MNPEYSGPFFMVLGILGILSEILSDKDRTGRYVAASAYLISGAIIYASTIHP